jgi:hypothetical protein
MNQTVDLDLNCRNKRTSLSSGLVDALAEAKGVEPHELDLSIFQFVDPSALDGMFDSSTPGISREGRITFPVEEFRVTIEVAPDDTASIRVESSATTSEESSDCQSMRSSA